MIEKNVGGTDRILRLAVGFVLALAGVAAGVGILPVLDSTVGLVVGVVAMTVSAGLIFTGGSQRCLVNYYLGRNTCEAG